MRHDPCIQRPEGCEGTAPHALRILIVEDEYYIADDLTLECGRAGVEVVGPVSTIGGALAIAETLPLDGAVLDIMLGGAEIYDVADRLLARNVLVVFVTGLDRRRIPARFVHLPFFEKPHVTGEVIRCLKRIGTIDGA